MFIARHHGEYQKWRANPANTGARIGLVPTMGHLHAGHLSLVERALALADRVVVTIFVNPMQFGPSEDLDSYPRTLQNDIEKLERAGVDALFTPSNDDIYPQGTEAHTRVSVPGLTDVLCGASRPGHFDGVSTIVCKLFNLTQPQVAVFGEKDLQQLLIIRKMVADLALGVDIEGVPTARESDGLAMSSRNSYLAAAERKAAPGLQAQLQALKRAIESGATDYDGLCTQSAQNLSSAGFEVDYLEIRCRSDLAKAGPEHQALAIFAAALLGTTRLIDNVQVDLP